MLKEVQGGRKTEKDGEGDETHERMYNIVSILERSFSWKGSGVDTEYYRERKNHVQGVLAGDEGLAEVRGCGFELSCPALLLDLLWSRAVVQEHKR